MNILTLENIKMSVVATSKQDVFAQIAELAVENNYANSKRAVIEGLDAREKESTTGMMDGFAIPHAKSTAINQAGIFIFSLAQGIEWASLDGQAIDFVVALLIPENEAGSTHLTLLSKVARLLMKEEVKAKLKDSNTAQEIYEIITERIG